jgi:hypothetical protein
MTLLPAACGEKKSVTSSSKNVRPEALGVGCEVEFSAHDAGLDLCLAIAQLPKRSKVQFEILRERKRYRRIRWGFLEATPDIRPRRKLPSWSHVGDTHQSVRRLTIRFATAFLNLPHGLLSFPEFVIGSHPVTRKEPL